MITIRIAVLVSFLICFVSVPSQSTPRVIEVVKAYDREALRELIRRGVDVNTPQGDGAAAIHWVSHSGDLEAATLLINAGANVKAANALGATPLWLAATNGDEAMVELLLEAGADPNTSLKMGETPLMAAARSGSVVTVERLLEYGADVDAKEIERGQTALMWAVAQQHRDVTQVLIRSGADLHARSKIYYQFENTAGNTNPSGNFEMAHGGSTPLLFSARNGDVDTARVLVKAGANVNDTMASGVSALVVAAHSGHTPFAIYLLEQGAAPNAAKAGYTALHAAVLRSRSRLVEALLEYGADPNARVDHGTPGRRFSADYSIRAQLIGANALWLAAKYGELDILRILIGGGADPHLIPKTGVSLLQAAMGLPRNSQENRRNRLDSFSQLNRVEEERLTLRLASIVLGLGVDINAADVMGNTALHHAVRKDFESVVEFLMLNGAEGERPNKSGQTPLVLAETPQSRPGLNSVKITRPKIAKLLRRFGVNN
ncbi:MAG: hypothetical protein CMN58_08360 [Solibacterales bacterium]|nr:hypothetical protein [Bryobacterales bacterium]|tara:strand:- start:22221 stop:23687 length:1467 start_codon:yes stop_codon:yes gene_type:complete